MLLKQTERNQFSLLITVILSFNTYIKMPYLTLDSLIDKNHQLTTELVHTLTTDLTAQAEHQTLPLKLGLISNPESEKEIPKG